MALNSGAEPVPTRKAHKEILCTCGYQWHQRTPREHFWKVPTALEDNDVLSLLGFVNNTEYILCVISIHNCKIYGCRQSVMFGLQPPNLCGFSIAAVAQLFNGTGFGKGTPGFPI